MASDRNNVCVDLYSRRREQTLQINIVKYVVPPILFSLGAIKSLLNFKRPGADPQVDWSTHERTHTSGLQRPYVPNFRSEILPDGYIHHTHIYIRIRIHTYYNTVYIL